jgi:hypothetical protein
MHALGSFSKDKVFPERRKVETYILLTVLVGPIRVTYEERPGT